MSNDQQIADQTNYLKRQIGKAHTSDDNPSYETMEYLYKVVELIDNLHFEIKCLKKELAEVKNG